MSTNVIFVEPLLSEKEAKSRFLGQSKHGLFSRFWHQEKKWVRFEMIYLPYFTFTYSVWSKEESKKLTVAVDALCGTFTYFEGNTSSEESRGKRTIAVPKISLTEAEMIARKEYQMNLLQTRVQTKDVTKGRRLVKQQLVYYPYWVGYFKRKGKFDFQALDGVNGCHQGIRMRRVFLTALEMLSEFAESSEKYDSNSFLDSRQLSK